MGIKQKPNIIHHSLGLYSTWTWVPPLRLLIDVGDGVSEYMGNRVFNIETIFISHDHLDHISGLVSFLGHRRSARGDKEKPLLIICTSETIASRIREVRDFTFGNKYEPSYEIIIKVLADGDELRLRDTDIYLRPFHTHHTALSSGVVLLQKTKRLKSALRNDPEYMNALLSGERRPGEGEYDDAEIPRLVYALDNNGLDFSSWGEKYPWGPDLLIDDLTFPEGHENHDKKHNDCNGIARNIRDLKPKKLILSHVSSRHRFDDYNKLKKSVVENIQSKLVVGHVQPHISLHLPSISDKTFTIQTFINL